MTDLFNAGGVWYGNISENPPPVPVLENMATENAPTEKSYAGNPRIVIVVPPVVGYYLGAYRPFEKKGNRYYFLGRPVSPDDVTESRPATFYTSSDSKFGQAMQQYNLTPELLESTLGAYEFLQGPKMGETDYFFLAVTLVDTPEIRASLENKFVDELKKGPIANDLAHRVLDFAQEHDSKPTLVMMLNHDRILPEWVSRLRIEYPTQDIKQVDLYEGEEIGRILKLPVPSISSTKI